jgi:hypothetical protein
MEKLFTVQEANTLLPVLEALLKRAMEGKREMEQVDREFRDLHHRIMLLGGMQVDVVAAGRRKDDREKALQRIKDAVAEIHATGVQVKDLDMGLLDFPHMVGGETVLLCWMLGEELRVQHWHGLEEGFAGRKPISSLVPRRDKTDSPEKPN